jgi:hypothetical protein
MADKPVFKSKIDAWLGAVLGLECVVLAGVGSLLLVLRPDGRFSILIGIILLAGAGLAASILAWTQYAFDGLVLVVRCGPFVWRIPTGGITGAARVRRIQSGPALSMDRIQIEYDDGKSILVSPADQAGFLAELEARRGSLQES